MSLVMAGEKQNIVQVIKNYGRQLFGFIRSRVNTEEDAEDILQDVWYRLSSLAKTDDIESISGWLYRVAKNRITDNYRRKKSDSLDDLSGDDENEGWLMPEMLWNDSNDPETQQLRKLFRQSLAEALEELPQAQRTVFILNELEDMTLQEIADREKENIKTIISRKRYAVQYLRSRLEYLYKEFYND
jgi:RNA polymerase sigma factor (sigma-70 family)